MNPDAVTVSRSFECLAHSARGIVPLCRQAAALAAVALAMTSAGCSACRQPVQDSRILTSSEAELRSDRLDLKALASDSKFELRGFAPLETTPQGVLAWSLGSVARLRLPFHTSGDKEILFRARAHESLGPSLPMSLHLNDVLVAELTVETTERAFRVLLPSSSQRRGNNSLAISVPRHRQPGADDPDRRPLAVAFSSFDVRPLSTGGQEAAHRRSVSAENGVVLVPSSSAAWYVRLPHDAHLRLQGRALEGTPRLTIQARTDDDTRTVATGRLSEIAKEIPVPFPPGTVARVEVACDTAGTLRLSSVSLTGVPQPAPGSAPLTGRPSVLVYLVDTLRADRLGLYGHPAPTSPQVDAFGAESLVFEDVWAQASWTRPATASIFTGLHPAGHAADRETHALSDDRLTLAEILRARGYRTGAFVANHLVGARYGFDQGYDAWTEEKASAAELGERALRWLDSGQGPFLMYLHTMEPHSPYTPDEAFAEPFAFEGYAGDRDTSALLRLGQLGRLSRDGLRYLEWQYEGEIRQNDAAFGALVQGLRTRGVLDDTIVVFVSDHGEELLDHGGTEHAKTLYQELVRVPLVVRLPGAARRHARVPEPVQQIDILPTLLGLLGTSHQQPLPGRDLSAPWQGTTRMPSLPPLLFAEERFTVTDKYSARAGDHKLIVNNDGQELWRAGTYLELYDLRHDPGEDVNLEASRPIARRYLFKEIERFRAAQTAGAAAAERLTLTDDEREQLRALGYIE